MDWNHLSGERDEEICRELLQLLRKQRETLDSATFLGTADWREYDERQARIRELSEQISHFQKAA
jgi:hypothetical protein